MTAPTRSILAVVVVLALAGVAYAVWQRFFSREAELDALHAACVAAFASGQADLKGLLPRGSPRTGHAPPDAVAEFSAWLGKLIDEVGGNASGAACGAVREACRLDFEGELCVRARQRFG